MNPYPRIKSVMFVFEREKYWANEEWATSFPKKTARIRSITPIIVASTIRPFLNLYIYRPMKNAIGTVLPMVKTPQELSARAFTTASPRPASAITRMKRTAIEATKPVTVLTSDFAISARDLPPCLTEAKNIMKS